MSRSEKTKSGFIQQIMGSTKRKNNNKHNGTGTRPVSANESDIPDDQEIVLMVHGMTDEMLNKEYAKIIDDMNIPKDKQAPLFMKSRDEKRDMIKMHLKNRTGKKSLNIIKWP